MESNNPIVALSDFLKEVLASPAQYQADEALRAALMSQGALAKLAIPSRAIQPSSINTLKRAGRDLEGGFDALDRLRRAAKDALEVEKSNLARANKKTKAGLKLTVDDLEKENQNLRYDLLRLTQAVETALSQSREYAKQSGKASTIALCEKEQREIRDQLSLRKFAVSTNVVTLQNVKGKALSTDRE